VTTNEIVKLLLENIKIDPEWQPLVVHWLTEGLNIDEVYFALLRTRRDKKASVPAWGVYQ
jgi:hypothetical protein